MIGVAVNQTARLNVVNAATPLPTANPVALPLCKLTLQIFDDQGTKLAELPIDNLAPGKAMHVDYARPVSTSPATPLRVQVRGVVTTALAPVLPVPSIPLSACNVASTLEVFDTDTGKTQAILSNPASVPNFILGVFTPDPPVTP